MKKEILEKRALQSEIDIQSNKLYTRKDVEYSSNFKIAGWNENFNRKSLTDLYEEYSKRYNGKPKHDFGHFIRVMSQLNHHRTLIRPQYEFVAYLRSQNLYHRR